MKQPTDYEEFESSSVENRRMLREEELILDVTIALSDAMDRAQMSQSQLASRLGKTPGFVSQILSGGRNLTLRTLADVADAMDSVVCVHVRKRDNLGIVISLDHTEINNWSWVQSSSPRIPGVLKTVKEASQEVAA